MQMIFFFWHYINSLWEVTVAWKGIQNNEAFGLKTENVHIFTMKPAAGKIYKARTMLKGCSVSSCIQEVIFCFEFELLRAQPCWFALCQWRAKKAGSWWLTLLPHIWTLLMTLLIQTKGQHSLWCFHDPERSPFNKWPGNGVKNWCAAMFYSIPINRASGAFSRWFPVLHEVQIQKSSTA